MESTKIRENALKAKMQEEWGGGGNGAGNLPPDMQKLVLALKAVLADERCPEWIDPVALAFDIGMRPYDVRQTMAQLFGNIDGARHSSRAWYSSDVLETALPVMFNIGDN